MKRLALLFAASAALAAGALATAGAASAGEWPQPHAGFHAGAGHIDTGWGEDEGGNIDFADAGGYEAGY
ncbi:hypothetical protein [Actinomadura fibrosa]|uniref:Uncharacterized protein n=1 Tax=Actinomadura fibrosa TaxID=111802 RepID=A0ABW2Y0S5_9ACTN|nr:hypothetical protein [Actinomadura fibrosa]